MIRDQWYPIELPTNVRPGKLTALRRLGMDLVLWRDRHGRVVCMEDVCPHKGSKMSLGKLKDDSIECPYHGFRFRADGDCVAAPCLGADADIPEGLKIRTLPIREAHKLIWLWFGDSRYTAPELPMIPEVSENTQMYADHTWVRPVHYTRYIESLLEFYHAPFVHAKGAFNYIDYMFFFGTPRKLWLDGVRRYKRATKVANAVLSTEGTRIDYSYDVMDETDPTGPVSHFDVVFQAPNMVHVKTKVFGTTVWYTPIDDENTLAIFRWWEYRDLSPVLPKSVHKVLLWASNHYEKWGQDLQDMRVVKTQQPRVSEVGANQLTAADGLNVEYLKLRERLKLQAAKPNAAAGRPELSIVEQFSAK